MLIFFSAFFSIVVGLTFSSAQANTIDPRLKQFGIRETTYTPLSCPASNETLKDFRGKLLSLKAAIKKEAANCNGASNDIEGLADLVTKDRENFLSLVTKGQVEGLSQQEQQTIENYVESVTIKATSLISVLTGDDACFQENKKGMSLDFISSLLGESSKILSVIGGPQIGGIVSVASGVVSGFSNAMQAINKTAQGYNFAKQEQKMAYADSLCALFDYRNEFDALLNPYETADRIEKLMLSLNHQLQVLQSQCSECADLILAVDEKNRVVTRGGVLEIDSVDQVWTQDFDESILYLAKEIDQIYTNSVGTHTYQALKMRTWLPLRYRAVESSQISADLGLASVLYEINNIEQLMVDSQAKKFIKQLAADANGWQHQAHVYLLMEGEYLASDLGLSMPYNIYYSPMPYEDMYSDIVQTLVDGVARTSDPHVKSRIRSYFAGFNLLSQGLNVSIDVANNYCQFFENSNWYRGSVVDVCPNNKIKVLEVDALRFTQLRFQMSPYAPMDTTTISDNNRQIVTASWMESMERTISDLSNKSDYVLRQSDTMSPNQKDPK